MENNGRTTLCLVLMVYNNEDVILDLLESVEKYIDTYVIVDNQGGSEDETEHLVSTHMSGLGITGIYREYPYPFHSGNKRTFALELANDALCADGIPADYLLVMDADNTLEIDVMSYTGVMDSSFANWPFHDLTAQAYYITKKSGDIEYPVISLLNNTFLWKYTGVIHEYPELIDGERFEAELLRGAVIHEPVKVIGEGEGQRPRAHYWNHALLLERELLHNKQLPVALRHRYMFYLGQSYRDAGMIDRAIDAYQSRINMGGWHEEVFYSYLSIARLKETKIRIEKTRSDAIQWYLKAWTYRPIRLEGVYGLMKIYIEYNAPELAYAIGLATKQLITAEPIKDMLFIEHETYTTLFPDLFDTLQQQFREKYLLL